MNEWTCDDDDAVIILKFFLHTLCGCFVLCVFFSFFIADWRLACLLLDEARAQIESQTITTSTKATHKKSTTTNKTHTFFVVVSFFCRLVERVISFGIFLCTKKISQTNGFVVFRAVSFVQQSKTPPESLSVFHRNCACVCFRVPFRTSHTKAITKTNKAKQQHSPGCGIQRFINVDGHFVMNGFSLLKGKFWTPNKFNSVSEKCFSLRVWVRVCLFHCHILEFVCWNEITSY